MRARNINSTGREEYDLRNDNTFLSLPKRAYPNTNGRRVSFGTIKCIPQPSEKVSRKYHFTLLNFFSVEAKIHVQQLSTDAIFRWS